MNEIHFRPSLWRRVGGSLLASFLLGTLLFFGLVSGSDLWFLPGRAVLVGVCLAALFVVLWLQREGLLQPESVWLSEGNLRLRHGGKIDEVRWTEMVSLWLNRDGKVLVVNRRDGSSIHASLGAFGEADLLEIERLARERLERVPKGAS